MGSLLGATFDTGGGCGQERLGEMPTGAAALGHDDDEGGCCSVLTLGGGASDPVVAFVAELIRAQVRLNSQLRG